MNPCSTSSGTASRTGLPSTGRLPTICMQRGLASSKTWSGPFKMPITAGALVKMPCSRARSVSAATRSRDSSRCVSTRATSSRAENGFTR